jgi:hypothetical protein
VAEDALDDQGHAERQQEPVEVIEVVQRLEHGALDGDADQTDDDGCDQQRPPVAQARPLQAEVRGEGAHHVLGAVGEVDDIEQAEDHREPEAEQRVEGAVDQPDEELTEQRLGRHAEDGHPGGPAARATS